MPQDVINQLRKAYKISCRNYGCPGSDGISLKEIRNNLSYHMKMMRHRVSDIYEGKTVFAIPKRTEIIDYTGKTRQIHVYNVYDRLIQQALRICYTTPIHSQMLNCVYSKRGVKTEAIFKAITKHDPKYVLKADIRNYYNSIDRQILKASLSKFVPDHLIKLAFLSFAHHSKGLPVGNCLSPLLSEYYLFPIDEFFKINYVRYNDDLYFAVDTVKEGDSTIAKLKGIIASLNLALSEDKLELISNPTAVQLYEKFFPHN